MWAAAIDPLEEMSFLQRQVEEGVLKVPEQDVLVGVALVEQQAVPQGQGALVPGYPQKEHRTEGNAVLGRPLPTPRLTHHLSKGRR